MGEYIAADCDADAARDRRRLMCADVLYQRLYVVNNHIVYTI